MVNGVKRFKSNAIVRWLLDDGPFDLNRIAVRGFDVEDQRQFAQLIGYSVSGYQDLSYSTVIDDDEDSSDAPTSVDFRGGRDLLPNAPGEVDACRTCEGSKVVEDWTGGHGGVEFVTCPDCPQPSHTPASIASEFVDVPPNRVRGIAHMLGLKHDLLAEPDSSPTVYTHSEAALIRRELLSRGYCKIAP
jgi:hypothetical protein